MHADVARRQKRPVVGVIATGLAAVVAVGSVAARAQGERRPEAEACFSAAEAAQPLMKDHKLRAAQRQLRACAREECPRAAREDCRTWLAQVTRAVPTVVFVAREEAAGGVLRAVDDVRVTVDGEALVTHLDATPVPVDPGVHAVRFEHGAFAPVEQRIDVREGESRREIDAVFRSAPSASASPTETSQAPVPPAPSGTDEPVEPPPPSGEHPVKPVPAAAYALGAVGIVALGVGITMEAIGLSDRQHLADTCRGSRSCAQSDVDAAHTRVLVGDIALGASALLFGGAAYVYFTRKDPPRASAAPVRVRLGSLGVPFGPSSGASAGPRSGASFGAAIEGQL
jgi:hypothetical protein